MSQTETQHPQQQAKGPFDVTMRPPQPPYDTADGISLGRMTIDKQFHGDLEATSVVEMMTAMTAVQGSAGYVAIERVTGTLHGKRGSFVLQHNATMSHGAQQLNIIIVPDSGTGELQGIAGRCTIDIIEKKHFYTLDYTIAP